jgi:hypothetical protein
VIVAGVLALVGGTFEMAYSSGGFSRVRARALAHFQGESAELASLWITYAVGDPDFAPTEEEGHVDCRINQPAPNRVTILTGNFGGTTVRKCSVPRNKPIFFPVLNTFFVNTDTGVECESNADCDLGFPAECGESGTCVETSTIDEKVSVLEFVADFYCGMEVFLDGDLIYPAADGIPLLRAFSSPTPGFWQGVDFDPEVIVSGNWALLPGLKRGKHTVRFRGGIRGDDGVCGSAFSLDVTYKLTVK